MAKPRKSASKPKRPKEGGLSRDERLAETPQEPLPFDGEKSMNCSFTGVREGEDINQPPPRPDASVLTPVGCPRVASGCVNADAECSTSPAPADGCGLFSRQSQQQAQAPPPAAPAAGPKILNLADGRAVLDLMYRARANREASEPRPLPRHWNGLNMRRG